MKEKNIDNFIAFEKGLERDEKSLLLNLMTMAFQQVMIKLAQEDKELFTKIIGDPLISISTVCGLCFLHNDYDKFLEMKEELKQFLGKCT